MAAGAASAQTAAADRLELGVVLRASTYGDGVSDHLPRQFGFDRFGVHIDKALHPGGR